MTSREAEMGAWYARLVADFERWLARKGRSTNTIETWRSPLRRFGRLLELAGVQDASGLSRGHLEAYQDQQTARRPNTQLVAATALRAFLRYLELEREDAGLPPGLSLRVVMPRQEEVLPRPLDPRDLQRILAWYSRPTRQLEVLRDRALFMTLLTSGARINEALQMTVAMILRGPIEVVQKGNRSKRLVLSTTARSWVEAYLRARGRDGHPELWVQLRADGTRPAMAEHNVNRAWQRLARRLDVPRFTSHQLRHTTATELGERGVGDADVAAVLGHANLSMLRRYRQVRESRRQAAVDLLDQLLVPIPPVPHVHPRIPRPGRRRRRAAG